MNSNVTPHRGFGAALLFMTATALFAPALAHGADALDGTSSVSAQVPGISPTESATSPVTARDARIADLLTQAQQARNSVARNTDLGAIKDAKRREALLLLQAAFVGDDTQEARRARLVAELRGDSTLPAEQRSELVAYTENLRVLRRTDLSRADRLAAYEETARRLIAEFPTVPTGYESLWNIARAISPEEARSVASELVENAAAPEFVRAEARALLDAPAVGEGAVNPRNSQSRAVP